MSSYVRRFLTDPGTSVLTNIEAVNIIDLDPPASIAGVGTGTVCVIGEFENGPLNTPTEVFGATDLINTFGGFGFVYEGTKANNPAARTRNADSNGAETWNGNGYLQLAGKQFSRLILVRVDTSVGAVSFTPEAFVVGGLFGTSITFSSSQTLILNDGVLSNQTVTLSGTMTLSQINTAVQTAVPNVLVSTSADSRLLLTNTAGGAINISGSSTALVTLGLPSGGSAATQAVPTAVVIPAGTVVANSGGHKWVTQSDLSIAAGVTGASSVNVRPATDDGTGTSATSSTVTIVNLDSSLGAFSVNNGSGLTAALTETALDSAYITALNTTVDVNGVSHDINMIFSARQSNILRQQLRQNALSSSANGCLGRMACIRPPLNTTVTNAGGNAGVGVGATRDQRVIYCYPQTSVYSPTIASVGTVGGTGFTATGMVDLGADSMMASILSQLNPEENPGQTTTFTAGVTGLESGANVQGLLMSNYINFRALGIAAPRVSSGVVVFQSGVTSVDPNLYPELRNIARRRMADYIQDTLALSLESFGKQLSTFVRRKAIAAMIRNFLDGLVSAGNPALQRIAAYSVDEVSGNTPTSLALGIFRVIVKVQTLASLDAIVLQTEIGESVNVSETSS